MTESVLKEYSLLYEYLCIFRIYLSAEESDGVDQMIVVRIEHGKIPVTKQCGGTDAGAAVAVFERIQCFIQTAELFLLAGIAEQVELFVQVRGRKL